MRRIIITLASIVVASGTAHAEGCDIADVLFGKVRIEYDAIVYGADFDSKRFSNYKILGQIAGAERDGSRAISDVNGELCGILGKDNRIDTSDADCKSCSKVPIKLVKVGMSYAVTSGGSIMGTIDRKFSR